MRPVTAQAIVAIPRTAAWARLQDLMLAKHYVPGVSHIEITTPNRTGLGASRRVTVKGRPPLDETVTGWTEGYGFTVTLHQGDQPASPFKQAQFVYRLDDAPGGQTRVTTTLAYELAGGIAGRIFDALLMRHISARMVATIASNLKRVYEEGAP